MVVFVVSLGGIRIFTLRHCSRGVSFGFASELILILFCRLIWVDGGLYFAMVLSYVLVGLLWLVSLACCISLLGFVCLDEVSY